MTDCDTPSGCIPRSKQEPPLAYGSEPGHKLTFYVGVPQPLDQNRFRRRTSVRRTPACQSQRIHLHQVKGTTIPLSKC